MLLTEDGKYYAYLNCFEDSVFKEVDSIVKKIINEKDVILSKEVDCFNKVFGVTCNKINGSKIDAFRIKEACLECGSNKMKIKESNPPEIVMVNIPVVEHKLWNEMTIKEKEKTIHQELKYKGCI